MLVCDGQIFIDLNMILANYSAKCQNLYVLPYQLLIFLCHICTLSLMEI